MSEIKFSEHPDYVEKAPEWKKLFDLHYGDHRVLTTNEDYLWPHELEQTPVEGIKLRLIRAQRSRYLNLMKPVARRWVSFLFKKQMTVPSEVAEAIGEDELEDFTGSGVSFEKFCKQVAENFILYGKPIVLIDSYNIKGETKLQSRSLGVRPYAELISPLELKDWQISSNPARKGRFDFIRFEYEQLEPRTSSTQAPEVVPYAKEISVVNNSVVISLFKCEKGKDKKQVWIPAGEITIPELKEIPVSLITSDSILKDASEQQLLLFNYLSTESCMANVQAIQKIFAIGLRDNEAKLAFGEFAINFLPDGADVKTIEPTNFEPIDRLVDRTIDRLFRVAFGSVFTLSSDSKEAPGADSQRESKEEFIAECVGYIKDLQSLINSFVEDFVRFKGGKDFKSNITLDTNVTIEDVDQQLAIFNAHRDDFKKLVKTYREILKKRAEDMNLPELEEIRKEIDATDFSEKSPEEAQSLRSKLLGTLRGEGTEESQKTA